MREQTKDLLWRRTWVASFHFRLTASCVISGTSGPKTDLNCLPSSSHCHCFVFIVRQILPVVFLCERQTNSPAGCRMLTVLPFSRNGLSLSLSGKFCMLCMWIARLWPLFRHVLAGLCACLFMLFWRKLKSHNWSCIFLFGSQKTQLAGIAHCCCNCLCSPHATPPEHCSPPLATPTWEWIEVKFCG